MQLRRRIHRNRKGTYDLRLPDAERRVLRSLGPQLAALLDEGDDPDLRRLFPTAYPDDVDHEEEYQSMVHGDLLDGRRRALEVVAATVDGAELDEEQLGSWMRVINDLRLVLGTKLDVSEDHDADLADLDDDDPQATLYALYHYLGFLLEQILDELRRSPTGLD